MASASNAARLCALACRRAPQLPRLPRTQRITRQCTRTLSSSSARWAERPKSREDDPNAKEDGYVDRALELKRMKESFAKAATPEGLQHLDELAKMNGFNTIDEYVEQTIGGDREIATQERALDEELIKIDMGEKPNQESFWHDEDDPEMNTEEIDEFDEDDMTSMAHGKLEEVKDMRQYARLIVWEMPLLSKLAKPFEVPTDKQVFRWRYTTYMGEAHPAERKVVLQFAPDDLKLSAVQTDKLKKLAGARYNPETELIKMSSDSYEHQAQNKRYLSDLANGLIVAAKDPADTFADIPLDTRHHEFTKKPRFPPEWRMTEERRQELNDYRLRQADTDLEREQAGKLVTGQKVIEDALMQKMLKEQEKEKVAELISAAPGRGGRARR